MSKGKSKRTVTIPKWCICTEGKTEELYLRAYCIDLGIQDIIDINSDSCDCISSGSGCGRQHKALIDQVQICNKKSKYGRMIIIHDFDSSGDKGKAAAFDETSQTGKSTGIFVFYSIPCFEYWLLLHNNYIDSNLSVAECAKKVKEFINAKRKEQGKELLHGARYKTDADIYLYFHGQEGTEQAIKNAKKRFENSEMPQKPSSVQPSSNLYLLFEQLKELSESRSK